MASSREFSLLVKIMGSMDPSLTKATNLTKRQIQTLKGDIDKIDGVLWGGLTKVAKVGLATAAAAGTATIAAGKKAVDVGSQFEKAMSQWAAVSDASVSEYNRAEAAAMKWGRQTTKTATESAEALTYMATAGWDVERSIDALPKVLKLAEATNLDLAHTSDLVTNAMAATGTEAQDLGRLLDIAAKANNKSNQTAEELLLAWRKTGANLENLHVDIAESATAIGMLSNRGKKAEEAGTALNAVLINMTTGAGQAGKMMDKLGLSAFDEQGNFKGLKQIFVELNDATKDLSDEERNQAFSMLGGKRQVEALTDVMSGLNHVLADGSTEWDSLYNNLMNADGALEKMAARRMDNLWGDLKILQSALQDSGIRAYKGFAEPLRDAAQMATEAVYWFSENVSDRIDEWYPTFRREMKESAEGVAAFAGSLMDAGNWVIKNHDVVGGALLGIATAITTFHTAWQGVKALDALATMAGRWGMGLGALLTPLAATSLAVGGTVAALVAFDLHVKKVNKQLANDSFAKHLGTIALNSKELRTVARQIVGEKDVERMSAALSSLKDLDGIGKELEESSDAIRKITMRVGAGLELDELDKQALGDSIESLIKQTESALSEHRLSLNLSSKVLFGDERGQQYSAAFTRLNDELRSEAEGLGEELGKAYKDAMADGIIEPFEAEKIEELRQQMVELNNEILNSRSQAKIDVAKGKLDYNDLNSDSLFNLFSVLDEEQANQLAGLDEAQAEVMAANRRLLDRGLISGEEYDERTDAAITAYRQNAWGVRGRANLVATDVLDNAYGADRIAGGYEAVAEKLSNSARRRIETESGSRSAGELLSEILMETRTTSQGVARSYFGAEDYEGLKEYYDNAKDRLEDLRAIRDEMISLGEDVPEDIMKGASLADMLRLAVGDAGYFDTAAEVITRTPELMELLRKAQEEGAQVPEALTEAIRKKQTEKEAEQKAAGESASKKFAEGAKAGAEKDVPGAADSAVELFKTKLLEKVSGGLDIPVNVKLNATVGSVNLSYSEGAKRRLSNAGNIGHNARGGIYSSPIVTEVAEAGYPEAIIPIDHSARAEELFRQTGRMLGADSGSAPAYAPSISITIQGNADERTIRGAMRSTYDEWLSYAQRFQRDQARLAY